MKYTLIQTSEFSAWMSRLRDRQALKAISIRLVRAASGNLGDIKSLGEGVSEMRVFVGKGYRVYFTFRGDHLILLLMGGSKSSQTADVAKAKKLIKVLKE